MGRGISDTHTNDAIGVRTWDFLYANQGPLSTGLDLVGLSPNNSCKNIEMFICSSFEIEVESFRRKHICVGTSMSLPTKLHVNLSISFTLRFH